jgi:hypothetical protein
MIELNKEISLGTLIENQFGDQYLFSVNQKTFEKIDYQTLFNKEFENTFDKEDTLYIITGTDSGLMVKQLIKTPPKKGSSYLFIEFPEIIELTKSQYSQLEEENNDFRRIIVTTEDQWEEEAKKMGLETYCYINKIKQIKSLAAQYYYLNEYVFLKNTIEDQINHLIWNYQTQIGNSIFQQRQLENLCENHTPAILLKDYFKGKSALILAGGPSLDKYMKWIEDNQEHYVVIAVTRIARRLLQTRIKPDIFVSVDPHPSNFNVSKEVFNFEKDSLLINQFHISPMLLGNWLGVNLYLDELFPWKTKLNVENIKGIGPTVTNTAIGLALNLGIKQQILFGVDLCYSPEGYTHAKGSREHDAGPDVNTIGYTVTTNKGEKAETNSAYYDAITSIEYLAELAQLTGGELLNPSPDSAQMKGVNHIAFDDIVIEKDQISVSTFLQEQFQHQEKSDFKIKHYQNILKELHKAQFKVNKIKALAEKGLEYNDKFFAGGDPSKNFQFKLKMDKLEKELDDKDLTDYTQLSKKLGVKEFLYFLNPDSDREWTNDEIKQSGDTYYKALKNGAIALNRHIFTAVNRTEIRLLENNALTVNDELIKRHLCSFDKSLLLDRQIVNQENNINKNINKQDHEQQQQQLKHLENLKNNKQQTIKNCKALYLTIQNNDLSLGETDNERIQALSFYLLMLQNEENYHTRRFYSLAKQNAKLLSFDENITILDEKPGFYIQKQKTINNTLVIPSKNNKLLKLQNQIANLAENHTPISVLKDYYKGKSALILTDKESLYEFTEWIEEHQEYFLIIALSHLSKILLSTKIKPDFFIATNPNESSFEENKAIVFFEQDSVLINQNSLLPKILGNWLGYNLYFGELFPWKSKLNIENISFPEQSDHSIAKSVATYLGIKDKLLFNESSINILKPENTVVPKDKVSISTFIQKQNTLYEQSEYKINHYKNVLYVLNNTYNLLNKGDKLKESSTLFELFKEFSENEFYTSNNNKIIKKGLKQFSRNIYTAIIRTEARLLENHHIEINDDMVRRHLSNNIDNMLLDKFPKNHPNLYVRNKVKLAFQNNTEERKNDTHFFMVMNNNGLNSNFRRVLTITENKPDVNKKTELLIITGKTLQEIIEVHTKLYKEIFSLNVHHIKFSGLEVKLHNLFMLKDKIAIQNIIKGIKLISQKSSENESYIHLAQGYLYELNNQIEEAISEYGQAVNPTTKESALKRIALITLDKGEVEHAHNALQILSEISPAYLPQLAELYYLTKNYKDALDAYTRYLDNNSSDISILLKVAKLYKTQNILDGEKFIYEQVLMLDPENLIAKEQLQEMSNNSIID